MKSKTRKTLNIAVTIILVVILVGSMFQAFITEKETEPTGSQIMITVSFKILEQEYAPSRETTYENTSVAQFLYAYSRGGLSIQSDGRIQCLGQCNNIETNTFWKVYYNEEQITDTTKALLKEGDVLRVVYD